MGIAGIVGGTLIVGLFYMHATGKFSPQTRKQAEETLARGKEFTIAGSELVKLVWKDIEAVLR